MPFSAIIIIITASKNFNVGICLDIYESVWFKGGVIIDTFELYILTVGYVTLTMIQGHRSVRKQKLLCQLSHKIYNPFARNLVYCWDLLAWWISYSLYLAFSVYKGENPAYVILYLKKALMLACIQTFTDQFFSDLVWWLRPLSSTCWYQFGWAWPSFKVTVVWEVKNLCTHFFQKFCCWFGWNSLCCPNLLVCWKLMLNLFYTSIIQGRELCWHEFIKYNAYHGLVSGHLWTNLF